MLPFSWAGILLLLVAFGFFIAEAFVTSHGALAVAGAVSFVFGALMLFDPAGDAYQVSLPVAIAIAARLVVLVGFALAKALAGPAAPAEDRPGGARSAQIGVGARRSLDPEGLVFVHGELWRARSATGETIAAGTPVRVSTMAEGLVLEVEPTEELAVAPSPSREDRLRRSA